MAGGLNFVSQSLPVNVFLWEKKNSDLSQGFFLQKILSKFLTELKISLSSIRSSPTHCRRYPHPQACSSQKGKSHLSLLMLSSLLRLGERDGESQDNDKVLYRKQ